MADGFSLFSNNCRVEVFSGMDDLDQVVVADITTGGNVIYPETPYIVAVLNSLLKNQTCTGFIISRIHVLAAGYCVLWNGKVVDPVYVSVLAGVYDFRDRTVDQWRYAVEITENPVEHKGKSVFVVIKVNEGFFMNFGCGVLEPKRESFSKNGACTAMSWRFQDKLDRLKLKSLVLRKIHGYVMNKTNCVEKYENTPVLFDLTELEFVCFDFLREPDDDDAGCMGADGSSLICDDLGITYPVGLALTYYGSSRCNRYDAPSLFIDVGAYSQWIYKTMS